MDRRSYKWIFSPFLWMGILLLASALLYAPVADFGYITGADQALITRNPLLNHETGWDLKVLFLSGEGGTYQPLTVLMLSLETALTPGMPARTIHLVNLALHLLNMLMAFFLVRKLSGKLVSAILVAGIVGFHPMNTAAVAWMSSQGILLSVSLMLLGALIYLKRRPDNNFRQASFVVWVFVTFILALLSHPLASVFPLLLVMADTLRGSTLRTALKGKIPYFMAALFYLVLALFIRAEDGVGPLLMDLLYYPYASLMMLLKFLLPFDISPVLPYPDHWVYSIAGFGAMAILFGGIFMLQRKTGLRLISPLIFYAAVLLISMLTDWQGHRGAGMQIIYLAGLGPAMLLAAAFEYVYLRFGDRVYRFLPYVLSAVYISMMALLAYKSSGYWRDGETYWSRVIRADADDAHAFFMRGDHYALTGNLDKARFDYQQCINRDPGAYEAMNNLGLIFLEENDLPLALEQFDRSIEIYDGFYKSWLNRGLSLMRLNRNEEALESISKAAAIEPDESLVYYNRGLVYERLNDLQNAISDFTRAISLNPSVMQFYKDRGKAYVWMRDFAAAEKDYSTILSVDPSNAEMWFRRSLARTSQDKFEEGLEDALRARSLGFPVEEEYIRGISVQALKDKLPGE